MSQTSPSIPPEAAAMQQAVIEHRTWFMVLGIALVILGMGKLGGRELNFSSDIDLIFCYSEDGQSDGDRELSAEEYFGRLSRQVIALIDEQTVDGFVFRVDTRLRPFGESGPTVASFYALESYLMKHGQFVVVSTG